MNYIIVTAADELLVNGLLDYLQFLTDIILVSGETVKQNTGYYKKKQQKAKH